MSTFTPGRTTHITDTATMATFGRAMRKTGRPVCVAVLHRIHPGSIAVVRAAMTVPRGVSVVTLPAGREDIRALDGVDCVCELPELPTRTHVGSTPRLTEYVQQINLTHATDIFVGEDDYPFLIALTHMVNDLGFEVTVHGVPVVRDTDGVPVGIEPARRDAAIAVSAALTAGGFVAGRGPAAVVDTVAQVLAAGGFPTAQVALTAPDLSPLPDSPRDGRLTVTVDDYADSVLLIFSDEDITRP